MNQQQSGDVIRMDVREYQAFTDFLRTACGIDLGDSKQYLVSTRVRRILSEHKLQNLSELTALLQLPSQRVLRQKVIDAMTTNETFWFRDTYPFEYLSKQYFPDFAKQRPGEKVRIWCAACSTGQEPYSISMLVEEGMRSGLGGRACEVDILATDVSTAVLETAREGVYDKLSLLRGLSLQRSRDFFTQVSEDAWRINDSVRQRVRFRPVNLQESLYLLGKFDVIFCRNVLIYFSVALKQEILRKLHSNLQPGGILFLGSSESITGLNDLYEMINCNPGVAYRAKSL